MEKIVITGATSSIGIELVNLCIEKNIKVLILARDTSYRLKYLPKSDLVTIRNCDLKDLKNFTCSEQYDVFYHLGWAYTNKCNKDNKDEREDIELQNKNILYSINAINLAKRLNCKKFIGAGSQAEYGIHLDKKTKPDSIANPISAYGICKYTTGKLLSIKAKDYNIDFAWVRIFSVYGKYDSQNTMILTAIKNLKENNYCAFTKGEHIWDYLYSEDAANAFYLLGEKLIGNKFYCLGSGQEVFLKQYINIIKNEVNSLARIGIGDIPYKEGVHYSLCADITSLTKDVGFLPKISFNNGIRKIIKSLY